ncbi:diguanylate cyclase [Rhodobacteraceae bacterium NNCM2]|nr:diguanylate cyclase [Coraliihabitans acroporae]
MDKNPRFGPPTGEITGPGHHAMLLIAIDNLFALEQFFGDEMVEDILKLVLARLSEEVPRVGSLWQPQSRRFAITVPGMSEAGARDLAKKVQNAISREPVETRMGPVAITASIGCAVADNGSLDSLGTAATDALIDAMASSVGTIRVARSVEEVRTHRNRVMCIAQTTMEALGAGRRPADHRLSAGGERAGRHDHCLSRMSRPDHAAGQLADDRGGVHADGRATGSCHDDRPADAGHGAGHAQEPADGAALDQPLPAIHAGWRVDDPVPQRASRDARSGGAIDCRDYRDGCDPRPHPDAALHEHATRGRGLFRARRFRRGPHLVRPATRFPL